MFFIYFRTLIIFYGMVAITILELTAMSYGIDGRLYALSVGGICMLAGYLFGKIK